MDQNIVDETTSVLPEKDQSTPETSSANTQLPIKWIVVGIIVIILSGAIAFFIKQGNPQTNTSYTSTKPTEAVSNSIDTTQWKTYENKKLSYSVQYPPDWSVYDNEIAYAEGGVSDYQSIVAIAPQKIDPNNESHNISTGDLNDIGSIFIESCDIWQEESCSTPAYPTSSLANMPADPLSKSMNGFEIVTSNGSQLFRRSDPSKNFVVKTYSKPQLENLRPIYEAITASIKPLNGLVFEDKRLKGMKFVYDTSRWELIQFSRGNDKIQKELEFAGEGILLRDKHSQDGLVMKYTLPYGSDGWVSLITSDRLAKLQDNLVRVKSRDSNTYQYGLASALVLFETAPESDDSLLSFCKNEKINPGQQYPVLDQIGCAEIESGKAIGLTNGPSLSYSTRFKNLVDLKEIDNNWVNAKKSMFAENEGEYVIVEMSYKGSNPSYADEVVQQIVH